MPQYNEMFELSLEDMDLIEESLRLAIVTRSTGEVGEEETAKASREEFVRQTHELLGRLHDQKVFYRPKSGVYVGG